MVGRVIPRKKPGAIRACRSNSKRCAGIAGVVAYSGAIPAGIAAIRNKEQTHHSSGGFGSRLSYRRDLMGINLGEEIEFNTTGIVVEMDSDLTEAMGESFIKVYFPEFEETISFSVAEFKRLKEKQQSK